MSQKTVVFLFSAPFIFFFYNFVSDFCFLLFFFFLSLSLCVLFHC